MIPVLIPCENGQPPEGLALAGPSDASEVVCGHSDANAEDVRIRVVPPDALQALLRTKLGPYEKRFGRVTKKDKAHLMSLFKLIEALRSPMQRNQKLVEYLGLKIAQRRLEREQATVKRSPSERESMVDVLFLHDKAAFERMGPLATLAQQLTGIVDLRLWQAKSTGILSPGILARDFRDSLLILLLLSLHSPACLAICAKCQSEYTRTKATQVFCSAKCAANVRKARQRMKEKEQHNGTQKTR